MSLDTSIIWYIAGPMSGRPQSNVPLFDYTAAALREKGLTICSPAEIDSPETRALALSSTNGGVSETCTWADLLSRDVKLIADNVGGIIFLPEWWTSRGARLEAFVGLTTGKQFAFFHPKGSWNSAEDSLYSEDTLVETRPENVRNTLWRFTP